MKNLKVLLLESRNDSLLPIAIILEMQGCYTVISSVGERDSGRLASSGMGRDAIDLLITDMPAHVLGELMPGSVPVLVLVNPENSSVFSVIRKKGFQFLEKPVEPLTLLNKIGQLLNGGEK